MKHPLTGYHLRFCDEDLFSNLEKLSLLTVSNSQNVFSAVFYYAFLVVLIYRSITYFLSQVVSKENRSNIG